MKLLSNALISIDLTARIFALALIAVGPGAIASDEYYSWKDEFGNIVMSDRPPTGADIDYETVITKSRSLRPKSPMDNAAPATGGVSKAPNTQPAGDAEENIQSAAAQRQVARDPSACQQARTNLEALTTRPRIRVYDEQGELKYLSEAEKEEQKRRAELTIEVHCEP